MSEITDLREKIDAVDDQILRDILLRVKICRAIGELKKQQGKPVHDIHRETEVFQRVRERAELLKLDPDRIERIYHEIVNMCSTVQH
ncbi:MAG: chorismate mutase [Candidatus Bathyarchaeota archaeon]|nr:chorismate mutase [Candidatus Bathyarchaeota archaeon]